MPSAIEHTSLASELLNGIETVQQSHIRQRICMLGIPEHEITDSVEFALTAVLEKLDDTAQELARTHENLDEIERLVDVDCLAPIPNRRAFMRRMKWAISMVERYNHPSTVLYFDLNNFKSLNDTHGHAAGDLAIKHVAHIFLNTMRDSDFVARIGGDEFAIIMYHAEPESAKARGTKIAQTIGNTPFMFNGTALYVKTAHGSYALQAGDDAESALSSADFSMYVDKRREREKDS